MRLSVLFSLARKAQTSFRALPISQYKRRSTLNLKPWIWQQEIIFHLVLQRFEDNKKISKECIECHNREFTDRTLKNR